MPAGHEKDNRAMIFGRTIQLKVDKNQSTIVFDKVNYFNPSTVTLISPLIFKNARIALLVNCIL